MRNRIMLTAAVWGLAYAFGFNGVTLICAVLATAMVWLVVR